MNDPHTSTTYIRKYCHDHVITRKKVNKNICNNIKMRAQNLYLQPFYILVGIYIYTHKCQYVCLCARMHLWCIRRNTQKWYISLCCFWAQLMLRLISIFICIMRMPKDVFDDPHELKWKIPNLKIIVLFALQASFNREFWCGDSALIFNKTGQCVTLSTLLCRFQRQHSEEMLEPYILPSVPSNCPLA